MLRPPFLHASSKCHCCWRILLPVVRMSWDVLGYPKVNAGNTTLLIHSYPYPQCQIPSTFRTPKCKPRFRLGFFMILGGSYLHTLYFSTENPQEKPCIWRSRTVSCRFSQSIDGSLLSVEVCISSSSAVPSTCIWPTAPSVAPRLDI